VNFGFSEEQELLRQEVRKFLDAQAPMAEIRRLAETPEGFSRDHWKQMGELGWLGLTIPETRASAGWIWWWCSRRWAVRSSPRRFWRRPWRRLRSAPPAARRSTNAGCRRSPTARRSAPSPSWRPPIAGTRPASSWSARPTGGASCSPARRCTCWTALRRTWPWSPSGPGPRPTRWRSRWWSATPPVSPWRRPPASTAPDGWPGCASSGCW